MKLLFEINNFVLELIEPEFLYSLSKFREGKEWPLMSEVSSYNNLILSSWRLIGANCSTFNLSPLCDDNWALPQLYLTQTRIKVFVVVILDGQIDREIFLFFAMVGTALFPSC